VRDKPLSPGAVAAFDGQIFTTLVKPDQFV
jgi:hypothetical protein